MNLRISRREAHEGFARGNGFLLEIDRQIGVEQFLLIDAGADLVLVEQRLVSGDRLFSLLGRAVKTGQGAQMFKVVRLLFTAAFESSRASQMVRVSGFWQ